MYLSHEDMLQIPTRRGGVLSVDGGGEEAPLFAKDSFTGDGGCEGDGFCSCDPLSAERNNRHPESS